MSTTCDKATVSAKTQAKAGRLADHAKAETDTKITAASKAEDEKTLSSTTADCTLQTEDAHLSPLSIDASPCQDKLVQLLAQNHYCPNKNYYVRQCLVSKLN
eukprot:5742374-Amphidinium_carterae.1